jgi:hypothetical protein
VTTTVSFVYVSVGLVVLLIGFLISKGMTGLIAGYVAGYDPSRVRDEKGLARWVGSGVMGIGHAGVLVGGLSYLLPGLGLLWVIAFVAVALGGLIALVLGERRFLK